MDNPRDDREGVRDEPLDPDSRAELLKRAWALLADKNYRAIRELLEPLTTPVVPGVPELGFILSAALRRLGEKRAALHLLEVVLESARRESDTHLLLESINLKGACLVDLGRLSEADTCFLEVLDAAVMTGDDHFTAVANHNLGVSSAIRSEHAESLAHLFRSLATLQRSGHLRGIGGVHQNVAMVYRSLGLFAEADSHFEHAYRLFETFGSVDELVGIDCERALLHCYRGDLRLAGATVARGLERARIHGLERDRGELARVSGIIAHARGDWTSAAASLNWALDTARKTANRLLEAEVLEELAVLAQAQGEEEEMQRLIEESAAVYERIGTPARAQRARERVGLAGVGESSTAYGRGADPYD